MEVRWSFRRLLSAVSPQDITVPRFKVTALSSIPLHIVLSFRALGTLLLSHSGLYLVISLQSEHTVVNPPLIKLYSNYPISCQDLG